MGHLIRSGLGLTKLWTAMRKLRAWGLVKTRREGHQINYTLASDEMRWVPATGECPALSISATSSATRRLGVRLHLSEVKDPVKDKPKQNSFLADLSGEVHLSQHGAICHDMQCCCWQSMQENYSV